MLGDDSATAGWHGPGVYEQRKAKRDGESGELIRSDVQFSTEILKMREMFRGIQR